MYVRFHGAAPPLRRPVPPTGCLPRRWPPLPTVWLSLSFRRRVTPTVRRIPRLPVHSRTVPPPAQPAQRPCELNKCKRCFHVFLTCLWKAHANTWAARSFLAPKPGPHAPCIPRPFGTVANRPTVGAVSVMAVRIEQMRKLFSCVSDVWVESAREHESSYAPKPAGMPAHRKKT